MRADYGRDEAFQQRVGETTGAWGAWRAKYLDCGGHDDYRKVVGLPSTTGETKDLITQASRDRGGGMFRGDGEIANRSARSRWSAAASPERASSPIS
jgi:hypothetical protein